MRRRRPDREDAAGLQRGMRLAQAVGVVQVVVRLQHQPFGPVVDVQQDGVIARPNTSDHRADVAFEHGDAGIGQAVPVDRRQRPARPGHHLRHQFGDGHRGVGAQNRKRLAQGEAHAQPADQHVELRPRAQPRAGQRRQRLFRPAQAAAHQLDRSRHDRKLGAPLHQTQFSAAVGHARRAELNPSAARHPEPAAKPTRRRTQRRRRASFDTRSRERGSG